MWTYSCLCTCISWKDHPSPPLSYRRNFVENQVTIEAQVGFWCLYYIPYITLLSFSFHQASYTVLITVAL